MNFYILKITELFHTSKMGIESQVSKMDIIYVIKNKYKPINKCSIVLTMLSILFGVLTIICGIITFILSENYAITDGNVYKITKYFPGRCDYSEPYGNTKGYKIEFNFTANSINYDSLFYYCKYGDIPFDSLVVSVVYDIDNPNINVMYLESTLYNQLLHQPVLLHSQDVVTLMSMMVIFGALCIIMFLWRLIRCSFCN